MPRLATGLRRSIPFQLMFDDNEDEYTQRVAVASQISRAEYVRRCLFRRDWRKELSHLRVKQKNLSKELRKELDRPS